VHKHEDELVARNQIVIKSILKWLVGIAAVVIAGLILFGVKDFSENRTAIQGAINAHETRLVRVETILDDVRADLVEIKQITKDIRQDQVRRNNIERSSKAKADR